MQVLGRKERCGETPCVFTLPEGHHTLRCTALDGRSKDVSVDIRADQTVEKKEQILDR